MTKIGENRAAVREDIRKGRPYGVRRMRTVEGDGPYEGANVVLIYK